MKLQSASLNLDDSGYTYVALVIDGKECIGGADTKATVLDIGIAFVSGLDSVERVGPNRWEYEEDLVAEGATRDPVVVAIARRRFMGELELGPIPLPDADEIERITARWNEYVAPIYAQYMGAPGAAAPSPA